MISDITVDLVALIKDLYEYPEYLRVVSSQLFYNRVLHKGSWRGRINWAPKGDQVFQLYWSSLLVACPRDIFSGSKSSQQCQYGNAVPTNCATQYHKSILPIISFRFSWDM